MFGIVAPAPACSATQQQQPQEVTISGASPVSVSQVFLGLEEGRELSMDELHSPCD